MSDVDPQELAVLVEGKLAASLGSHWLLSVPAEERSFEDHLAWARKRVRTLPVWALATERKPYGEAFVSSGARALVERSLREGTFLEVQKHPDGWLSSPAWLDRLGALDDPARAIDIALDHESAGCIVDANAAFAAARWLDPHAGGDTYERVLAERPAPLPDAVADQPMRGFTSRRLGARHHAAWRMGKLGRTSVPSLLAYESDPSFWVRTRIYRSLGQVLDPACIQALHEGTLDPHPFARAQAVRSLGWLGDPTLIGYLAEMRSADVDAEVRRSASLAVERIRGFWLYFGEWNDIAKNADRVVEVCWALVREGLGAFAYDVALRMSHEASEARTTLAPGERVSLTPAVEAPRRLSDPRVAALAHELRRHAIEHDPDNPRTSYYAWQGEALGAETTPAPEPSIEEARGLFDEEGKVGWNARRVLRRHGAGSIHERRFHVIER